MNNEKVDDLVLKIVEIEREVMHKKFNTASGLGKKYVKDKTDNDVINEILTLINKEDNNNED